MPSHVDGKAALARFKAGASRVTNAIRVQNALQAKLAMPRNMSLLANGPKKPLGKQFKLTCYDW